MGPIAAAFDPIPSPALPLKGYGMHTSSNRLFIRDKSVLPSSLPFKGRARVGMGHALPESHK